MEWLAATITRTLGHRVILGAVVVANRALDGVLVGVRHRMLWRRECCLEHVLKVLAHASREAPAAEVDVESLAQRRQNALGTEEMDLWKRRWRRHVQGLRRTRQCVSIHTSATVRSHERRSKFHTSQRAHNLEGAVRADGDPARGAIARPSDRLQDLRVEPGGGKRAPYE
eukprot:2589798-Prymnesium_polylepis.1